MFDRLALHLFKQFVAFGTLSVTIGSGAVYRMTENRPGPKVAIKIANSRTLWRVVMKPDLVIGEAYMDGLLRIENDDLESFVELLMLNSRHWAGHWAGRLSLFLAHRLAFLSYWNKPRAARRNVAHHYDLTDQLFDSFLDPRRQYSCAYFESPDTPLDVAQNTKIARLAAKLSLRHGDAVLDIGCGWGGLATALCTCREKVHVTGITLSTGQLAYATKKQRRMGFNIGLILPIATTANRQASLTRLYRLACSNMSGRQISKPISARSKGCCGRTALQWSTALAFTDALFR